MYPNPYQQQAMPQGQPQGLFQGMMQSPMQAQYLPYQQQIFGGLLGQQMPMQAQGQPQRPMQTGLMGQPPQMRGDEVRQPNGRQAFYDANKARQDAARAQGVDVDGILAATKEKQVAPTLDEINRNRERYFATDFYDGFIRPVSMQGDQWSNAFGTGPVVNANAKKPSSDEVVRQGAQGAVGTSLVGAGSSLNAYDKATAAINRAVTSGAITPEQARASMGQYDSQMTWMNPGIATAMRGMGNYQDMNSDAWTTWARQNYNPTTGTVAVNGTYARPGVGGVTGGLRERMPWEQM